MENRVMGGKDLEAFRRPRFPGITPHYYTASEVRQMAAVSGLSTREVLMKLREAGQAVPKSSPTACAGAWLPRKGLLRPGSTSCAKPTAAACARRRP